MSALTLCPRRSDLEERLTRAEQTVKTPRFGHKKGLGNEAHYIFDYPPQEEPMVRTWVARMKADSALRLAVFDLYDEAIELLREDGSLEKYYELEKNKGLGYVAQSLSAFLGVCEKGGPLTARLRASVEDTSVVFLTGLGKCYPFLRSYQILNNLPPALDDKPVVLFYPGRYNGRTLTLFGEINEGNYFRALRLAE